MITKKPNVIINEEHLNAKIIQWLQDKSLASAKIYPVRSQNGVPQPARVVFKSPRISAQKEFAYILLLAGFNPNDTCVLSYTKDDFLPLLLIAFQLMKIKLQRSF